MPRFEITAPDGRRFEVTGDRPPEAAELQAIMAQIGGAKPQAPRLTRDEIAADVEARTAAAAEPDTYTKATSAAAGAAVRAATDPIVGAANILQRSGLPNWAIAGSLRQLGTAGALLSPLISAGAAAEEVAAGTPGNETVAEVGAAIGSGLGSMPAAMIPGGGLAVSAAAAGLQSYEQTRREALEAFRAAGLPEDDADRSAHKVALGAGVITGGVTGAFNAFGGRLGLGRGVERGLGDPVRKLTVDELKKSAARPMVEKLLREVGGEATEEAVDQALQEGLVRWQYDQTQTFADAVKQVLKAGALGGVAGGVIGGVPAAAGVVGERRESVRQMRQTEPGGPGAAPADTGTPPVLPPAQPAGQVVELPPQLQREPGTWVYGVTADGKPFEAHTGKDKNADAVIEYMARAMPGAKIARVEFVEDVSASAPITPDQAQSPAPIQINASEPAQQTSPVTPEPDKETPAEGVTPAPAVQSGVVAPDQPQQEPQRETQDQAQSQEEVLTTAPAPTTAPKRNPGLDAIRSIEANRPPDFLDWIQSEVGRIRSKGKASEATRVYYSGAFEDAAAGSNRNLFSGTGTEVDVVAEMAFRAQQIPEPTADALWEAMAGARRGRQAYRRQERGLLAQGREMSQQSDRFERAAIQGKRDARFANRSVDDVTVGDLMPGDEFTVAGERVVVRRFVFDPETDEMTAVELEDGRKFGTQVVSDGTVIKVDRGTLVRPEPGATGQQSVRPEINEPFSIRRDDGGDLFGAPESVEQQKARLAREAAQRKAKEDRQKMLDRQAAPLTGRPVDTTGDMLDPLAGDAPLFQQAAKKGTLPPAQGNLFSTRPEVASTRKMTTEQVTAFLTRIFRGKVPDRIVVSPEARMTPAGDGVVEGIYEDEANRVVLFAPNLRGEADVRRVLRHELLHDVFNDPAVAEQWRALRWFLTRGDVGQARAEGYGSRVVREEAQIDVVESRVNRKEGLFRKWVNAIVDALNRKGAGDWVGAVFGVERMADSDARVLVQYAERLDRAARPRVAESLRGSDARASLRGVNPDAQPARDGASEPNAQSGQGSGLVESLNSAKAKLEAARRYAESEVVDAYKTAGLTVAKGIPVDVKKSVDAWWIGSEGDSAKSKTPREWFDDVKGSLDRAEGVIEFILANGIDLLLDPEIAKVLSEASGVFIDLGMSVEKKYDDKTKAFSSNLEPLLQEIEQAIQSKKAFLNEFSAFGWGSNGSLGRDAAFVWEVGKNEYAARITRMVNVGDASTQEWIWAADGSGTTTYKFKFEAKEPSAADVKFDLFQKIKKAEALAVDALAPVRDAQSKIQKEIGDIENAIADSAKPIEGASVAVEGDKITLRSKFGRVLEQVPVSVGLKEAKRKWFREYGDTVFVVPFENSTPDDGVRFSLRRITSDPVAMREELERQKEAGKIVTPALSELIHSGLDTANDLGGSPEFGPWSKAMAEKHGEPVRPLLRAAWARLDDLRFSLRNGIPPEAIADIARIMKAAELAPNQSDVQPTPVYDPEKTARWWMKIVRPSDVIRYFGGDELLKKKGEMELATAYQSAAVQRQAETLKQQLEDSFHGDHANPILRMVRRFFPRTRLRRFIRLALPIAAHLNVTGGQPGAFDFSDFEMRAGFIPESQADRQSITTGDDIWRDNPVTGELETLKLGPKIELESGAKGYQLLRSMPATRQQIVYEWARNEFPEFEWFLNTFIDPRLKDTRVNVAGVEVPVFNRFALAGRYAQDDPSFMSRPAYTPEVSIGMGLVRRFAKARKVTFREGTKSPGRKYETGTAREASNVLDLLSGFNVRAMQVLQEETRKKWMKDVFEAATPVPPEGQPAGWVPIENAMDKVWNAVQTMRKFDSPDFPETAGRLADDNSPEYRRFFGEVMRLRKGDTPLMLPEPVVDAILADYAVTQELSFAQKLIQVMASNWKAFLLLMPDTFIENRTDNYLRLLMQSHRQLVLAAIRGGDRLALREAKRLAWTSIVNIIPGVRQVFRLNSEALFQQVVNRSLPEEIFAGQTRMKDLWIERGRTEEEVSSLLDSGQKLRAAGVVASNLGPLILEKTGYGNIDVRAKQQFAFSMLLAQAEQEAWKKGLRGGIREKAIEHWMLNPPRKAVLRAVDGANRLLLNYSDAPGWLSTFARVPIFNAVVAFPMFRYHWIGREIDRATSAFRAAHRLLVRGKKLSREQWAASLADTISYVTLPVMGYAAAKVAGALSDSLIGGLGDDDDKDDPREMVGDSSVFEQTEDGGTRRKPLAREMVLANRLNISRMLAMAGVKLDGEQDYWWHIKDYPMVRSAALFYLSAEDAKNHGAKAGFVTLWEGAKDLLSSLTGAGQAIKIPAKILAEIESEKTGKPVMTKVDPYATNVPLSAYITLQALNLIPGQRQADEMIKWLDPVPRRITRSKSLGYDPGVTEALQVGGWTGLADRLARGLFTGDASSPLPPQGAIDRRAGVVAEPRKFDLTTRIAAMFGQNIKPVPRREYREALEGQSE